VSDLNLFPDPLGAKPNVLKKINLSTVVRVLMKYQPISRTDIAKKTGISKPTVSKLVNLLMADDYLTDAGKKKSTKGKRQSLLALNPERAKNIVVDIGLRKTTISIVDFSFNINQTSNFDTISDPDSFIRFLCSEIKKISENMALKPQKVILSVSGTVDKNLKKVYEVPLLKWKNILLADLIELELDKMDLTVEVLLENDANLGIIAEVMLNREIDTRNKNIVYILVKEGIGLGFFINNGFYYGKSHSAGEFGHMVLDMNAAERRTWLELAGSEELERYQAEDRMDEYIQRLGTGFLNIVNGLDPDQCVFSGACCQHWDAIYPGLREMVNKKAKIEHPEGLKISCSGFENIESPLLGGAVIGFKDYIEMSHQT